jgi:Secretion system C-terminal sorting domain
MKHILLIFFVLSLSLNLFSQRDSANYTILSSRKELIKDELNVNVSIYPVPVRENNFTIKSDKEISSIKITNIIGQDIFSVKYNTPLLISKIVLDNPRRGMYLVVILFSDDTRVVKKVMVEGTN